MSLLSGWDCLDYGEYDYCWFVESKNQYPDFEEKFAGIFNAHIKLFYKNCGPFRRAIADCKAMMAHRVNGPHMIRFKYKPSKLGVYVQAVCAETGHIFEEMEVPDTAKSWRK